MRWFERAVGRIEIAREGSLERVYFPIPLECLGQWKHESVEKTKQQLLYNVNRCDYGFHLATHHVLHALDRLFSLGLCCCLVDFSFKTVFFLVVVALFSRRELCESEVRV